MRCAIVSGVIVVAGIFLLIFFFVGRMTPPPLPASSGDYSFTESVDASIARYTAALTDARLETPGEPPKSTLIITDGTTGDVLGTWTLGSKEFWTSDPESGVIVVGSFDVHARCYTHEVWAGDYSPGIPLTTHAAREFCF